MAQTGVVRELEETVRHLSDPERVRLYLRGLPAAIRAFFDQVEAG